MTCSRCCHPGSKASISATPAHFPRQLCDPWPPFTDGNTEARRFVPGLAGDGTRSESQPRGSCLSLEKRSVGCRATQYLRDGIKEEVNRRSVVAAVVPRLPLPGRPFPPPSAAGSFHHSNLRSKYHRNLGHWADPPRRAQPPGRLPMAPVLCLSSLAPPLCPSICEDHPCLLPVSL